MNMNCHSCWSLVVLSVLAGRSNAQEADVDLAGYSADCGVQIKRVGQRLVIDWPMTEKEHGRVVFDLRNIVRPLIESIGIAAGADQEAEMLLRGVDPYTFLTVGTRQAPPDRPPQMPIWNVFFDKPASRPHGTYPVFLFERNVRVVSERYRASVTVGKAITARSFA